MEIMSQEDQDFLLKLLKSSESLFPDPELSYWWAGLQDLDDDRIWTWVASKRLILEKYLVNN